MSLGSTTLILVGVFVALLLVVWLLMATSKSAMPRPHKGEESPASEAATLANDDAAKKAAAEVQSKNINAAVGARWWLNQHRDSEDKRTGEDKPL